MLRHQGGSYRQPISLFSILSKFQTKKKSSGLEKTGEKTKGENIIDFLGKLMAQSQELNLI